MDTAQLLNLSLPMQWDYDADSDVLYMSVGEPQPALGVDIGEGLVLRYSEIQSAIVGLTVIGLKSRLDQNYEQVPIPINLRQHSEDNDIVGDKVQLPVNKAKAQTNHLELAQAAHDIRAILNELSEEYNPTTAKGQARIKSGALTQIGQNPQLKQCTIKALELAGEEALGQAIEHPVAKVVVEAAKGFLQS